MNSATTTPVEITVCSLCEQEMVGEALHELRSNEGYTGCCNKTTKTILIRR